MARAKPVAAVAAAPKYRSADERRALGKALRTAVPRASQAGWKPPEGRFDPVDLLVRSSEGRMPELIPIRYGRMAQSPFAFFRGNALLMAADLAATPRSGLVAQICGDAHLSNFGGFATPERNVIFDINDFDETLPGPWEWDIKRLAASIVIAARHLRFSESDAARAAANAVMSYRERMADYAGMRMLEVWYDRLDAARALKEFRSEEHRAALEKRIEQAAHKSAPDYLFPKLVQHVGDLPKIKDEPPLIFHAPRDYVPGERDGYRTALQTYRGSLPEHVRALFDRFHLQDLALKVVGVGSVGTRCAVALLMAADNDPIFLQVKEARPSVLAPYAGASLHHNNGERVVAGQRLMQAASDMFLGWTRGDDGNDYYVRQLRDLKISPVIEDLDVSSLRSHARLCAWSLARAHARSGDAAMIAGYLGSTPVFDDAVCEFAVEYADQNQKDYRAFLKAIREGRISIISDA